MTDSHQRSSSSESSGSDEDYEMANLDDIAVTPMHDSSPRSHLSSPAHEYTEYDEQGEDEGQGLLESQPEGMRGKEGTVPPVWAQVSSIVVESAPTLLLTTIGLLFTGGLLDQVSRWKAMRQVDQLIIIIPVILNLKGNLEMNLSARLGTAANIGELDKPETRRRMILGNLTLLQVQATVVSFVAAGVSLVLGLIVPHISPERRPGKENVERGIVWKRRPRPAIPERLRRSGWKEFVMVASTSMTAACLSSVLLGTFMCFLIVLCRRFGRDPDNIAPPIASCLGDLVTLSLMGAVSSVLINLISTPWPLVLAILVCCSAAACGVVTYRNDLVKPLLTQGWVPLFGAMIISSGTGIILDMYVTRYEGFALLAVVISGLPGSVGAIFVSRLGTALHAAASTILPTTMEKKHEPSPLLVATTLLIVTLPVEVIFLAVLHGLGWLTLPFMFTAFSVVFFCVAVISSLFLARVLTQFLWNRGCDPDMYAMPVHSALMDLIGQLLLVLCFEIVSKLGAQVRLIKPGG